MLFLSFVAVYSFFFFGLSTGISCCLQYLLQLDKFNTFRGKEKKEKIKSTRPPSIDDPSGQQAHGPGACRPIPRFLPDSRLRLGTGNS